MNQSNYQAKENNNIILRKTRVHRYLTTPGTMQRHQNGATSQKSRNIIFVLVFALIVSPNSRSNAYYKPNSQNKRLKIQLKSSLQANKITKKWFLWDKILQRCGIAYFFTPSMRGFYVIFCSGIRKMQEPGMEISSGIR